MLANQGITVHDSGASIYATHTIGSVQDWRSELKLDTGRPTNPGEERNTISYEILRIQKIEQTRLF